MDAGWPVRGATAVASTRRTASRQNERLQVGRSWRFLSDLELSKEASNLNLCQNKCALHWTQIRGHSWGAVSET